MKNWLIAFLGVSSLLQAEEKPPQDLNQPSKVAENCDSGSQACTVTARYIQGAGIGYNRGYTTFETFLAPPRCFNEWNPYVDLRGHAFNNGYLAANAGVGVRYVSSVSWGANAYYDYRNTKELHYNQIGAGFEAIGSFWRLNVNGYLPVGKKQTPFFDSGITGTSAGPDFSYFQGNQIFLQLSGTEALTAKREFAFKGLNASAAFRVVEKRILSIDVAAGPYYFDGYYKKYAVGGQGSISVRVGNFFSLGLIGSYDNLFHGRIQGAAGFSIPLGPKSFQKTCSLPKCSVPSFYDYNLARGAERSEIVVVDRHEEVLASATEGSVTVAINPATGTPYLVLFVDNTSSSDGTFESPYSTLLAAQMASGPNDLIYVFPGDGTNMGMAAGIVMQDNQMLLGSSTAVNLSTSLGPIVIPAQSTTSPLITNAGGTVVTLANNNIVSGIHVGSSTTGIDGTSITDLQILACQMDASTLPVSLNEVTGSVTISNSSFSEYTDQAVRFIATSGTSSLTMPSNTFAAMAAAPNTYGVTTNSSGSSDFTISISDSTFSEHTNTSISLASSGSSILNPTISNNTITAPSGVANTIAIQLNPGGTSSTTSITDNMLLNHESNSLNMTVDTTSASSITASGNTIQGISGTSLKAIAIDTANTATSNWTASILNNTCSGGFTQADIYLDPRGSSTLAAIVTGNTTLGDSSSSPFGIQIDADDTATISSALVSNNISKNHTGSEMAFSSRGTMTSSTLTISDNQLTGQVTGGNGIQLNSSSGGALMATASGNTITDMHNTGITLSANNTSSLTATLSSNQITAATGIVNTTAIGTNSNDTSSLIYTATNNTLQNHSGVSISSNFNGSAGSSTLTGNTIVGIAGTSAKGIALDSGNTSSLMWSVDIQNNTCTGGFTQADIYVDPRGTSTLTSAIISGNTAIGPDDGSAPQGLQLDADDGATVTSLLIDNNICKNHSSAEINVTARGSTAPSITTTISNNQLTSDTVTTQSLISLSVSNNGTLTGTVSDNTCTGTSTNAIQASGSNTGTLGTTITGNSCSNYNSNGISVNASNTAAATSLISNNTVTGTTTGISVNINDTSTMDTTISSNTVANHEGQSIGVNFFASSLTCTISDNDISIGSTTGAAFGIITNLGGSTQTVAITGNTVLTEAGGIGSQFGIVVPQQSGSGTSKAVTVSNNMLTDCGNAPASGPTPFTAGIAIALISSDSLFADCQSNTTVNCGTGSSGQGGILGGSIDFGGGVGHYCWRLQNCNSDSGFTLLNGITGGGMAADFTLDASGNTGAVTPFMGSPFTVGTCP